jgi:hypothetical protein
MEEFVLTSDRSVAGEMAIFRQQARRQCVHVWRLELIGRIIGAEK